MPYFDIHPDTAAKYGVAEGQWTWIENQMGKCRQVARFNDTLDPRVISTEHGWWFPEQEAAEPSPVTACSTATRTTSSPCARTARPATARPSSAAWRRCIPARRRTRAPEDQPTYQVTRTNGYTHGPSHKTDEPSFYDWNK